MPANSTITAPAADLDQIDPSPVGLQPLPNLLMSSTTCDPNVLPHHLQEDNIHLVSYPMTSSPIMIEPFSLTNHHGLTSGRLQFQQVIPDRCYTLNFSSLGMLLEFKEDLSSSIQMKIDALDNKRTNYPDNYRYEDYFPQCSLISMLDQTISTQVCFCGLQPHGLQCLNKTGLCNKPRLCKKCASRNVQTTLKTFLPNFHRHEWGFLTISYHGVLNLTHVSGADWWLHWDAARTALKRLVDNETIGGAMIREELAIISLSPTTVQPHLHAIIPTGELSESAIHLLNRWTESYCDDMGDTVSSEPSIVFKPIPTEEDFNRVVQYVHKPIDLVAPYQARWGKAVDAADMAHVNRAARDLIEAAIMLPKDRVQIDYFGNMRAASRARFIGVPKAERL